MPGQHSRVPRGDSDQLHHLLDQWLGPLRPRPPLPPRPGVSAQDLPRAPPAEPTLTVPVSPHRDLDSVDPRDPIRTHQMMLDAAEQELGIQPVLSSAEMAAMAEPSRLGLITYLSQFYEAFKTSPGVRFWGFVLPQALPGLAGCPHLCRVGCRSVAVSPLRRGRGAQQEAPVSPGYARSHPLPQQAAEEPQPGTQARPGGGPTQTLKTPQNHAPSPS